MSNLIIDEAINALPSTGGKIILDSDTYVIDNSIILPSNVTLEGQNKNTIIKLKAHLNNNCKKTLHDKLKTYTLDEKINYAIVVLKILTTNPETKNNDELTINLALKVHYVTPFVTKKLAEDYIKELSQINKLTLFFPVKNGKIIVNTKDELYTHGEWNFSEAIVNAGSYFESNNVVYDGVNDFDLIFDNVYINIPTYLVHPKANIKLKTDENGNYIGLHIEPINGLAGDNYNIIAFCKGKITN